MDPVRQNQLCFRATVHRRTRVAHLATCDEHLRLWVYFRRVRDPQVGADGWSHVGWVIDQIARKDIEIWWEADTDRLQLRGPAGHSAAGRE